MTSVVFVKYNSHWDENNVYIDNESRSILVFISISYVGLLERYYLRLLS